MTNQGWNPLGCFVTNGNLIAYGADSLVALRFTNLLDMISYFTATTAAALVLGRPNLTNPVSIFIYTLPPLHRSLLTDSGEIIRYNRGARTPLQYGERQA